MKINLHRSSLLLACLSLSSAPVFANTVFLFNSSTYVGSNYDFNRSATLGNREEGDPYVYSIPFSTAPLVTSTNYHGPAFYGGFRISSTNRDVTVSAYLRNNVSASLDGPFITVNRLTGSPNWASDPISAQGVLMFDLERPASVDGFNISVTDFGSAVTNTAARWVVKVGDNYYVSNSTFIIPNSIGDRSSGSLSEVTWALYNPATDLAFSAAGASFTSLSLTNVTAIGVQFQRTESLTSTSSAGFAFAFTKLEVTGAFIPEPSTLALLLGLLALGVPALRRILRSPATRR
ncbi:hypothetical protein Ga0100231_024330 [Opitutaceae bacterium TAV4]|nr:hypothetical protein Ga0100231_021805 [Opitutaceae bacterium TAV4]RRJ96891.1 hypothetical protein Ga0100231_024330 [Opitutaceae bacterium TAV4]RRK00831.1 hypothetical protein Ga0100230_023905 [Opitutaceae bacterium TAV3]